MKTLYPLLYTWFQGVLMKSMTIGSLAREAGVGIETIRYYEREGLLDSPERLESGYRQYNDDAIARLEFIKRAKKLGFSLREIRDLISLKQFTQRDCHDIRTLAESKLEHIESKIAQLERMKGALDELIESCCGDGKIGTCPIIESLNHSDSESLVENRKLLL